MTYFSPEFIRFLKELEKNNEREWFHANKKRYEQYVKEPFAKFVDLLIERVHEDDPQVKIQAKDAIFRIYRDVRFAKDKSPYKTAVSAIISRGGRKDMVYPGMYIELKATEARVYGGAYMPDRQQLESLRNHIILHEAEFKKLLSEKAFVKKYGEMQGAKHKRLSKEMKEAAESQPLIYNKQFYYYAILPASAISSDDFLDIVMDHYHAGNNMRHFLANGLGFSSGA